MIVEGSTWDVGVKKPSFPKLQGVVDVDVAIIGGGITGITAAYFLSKAGKRVALIEKNTLCTGATGATTAFLTLSVDTDFRNLIKMYGKRKARLIAESHQYAINTVERIVNTNSIKCEFMRCSNYSYAIDTAGIDGLEEEEKAMKQLGIPVHYKRDDSLNIKNYAYLEIPNQAKFHPLQYLYELARIAVTQGTQIFEKTEAEEIEGLGPYEIKTKQGTLWASQVIVATYTPFDRALFFKKAYYTSYVFEAHIPPQIIPERIYEDTRDPYHYFRVDRKGKYDRLIIGGEDHRSDFPIHPSKNFHALQDYLKEAFPNISCKLVRKWEGPIVEPVDGLAFIGPRRDRKIFYATGFSGNGMTYGTLAALICTASILGNKNEKLQQFASLYKARRMPTLKQLAYKGIDYSKEMIFGAIRNTFKYKKNQRLQS